MFEDYSYIMFFDSDHYIDNVLIFVYYCLIIWSVLVDVSKISAKELKLSIDFKGFKLSLIIAVLSGFYSYS